MNFMSTWLCRSMDGFCCLTVETDTRIQRIRSGRFFGSQQESFSFISVGCTPFCDPHARFQFGCSDLSVFVLFVRVAQTWPSIEFHIQRMTYKAGHCSVHQPNSSRVFAKAFIYKAQTPPAPYRMDGVFVCLQWPVSGFHASPQIGWIPLPTNPFNWGKNPFAEQCWTGTQKWEKKKWSERCAWIFFFDVAVI